MGKATATCTRKDDGYFEYYQRSGCGHAFRVETQYLARSYNRSASLTPAGRQQANAKLAAVLAKPCAACMRRNHRLTALCERACARALAATTTEAEGYWLARADAYLCAAVEVAR